MNKVKFKKIAVIFCLCLVFKNFVYAGSFIDIDGDAKYVNDLGEIVKDTWAWVDTNNDSIAECFRFDTEGHILKNYESPDGHKTNGNGELLEGDVVVKKMLSSGEIISNKPNPLKGLTEFIGNVIGPKNKKVEKDRFTGRDINYETYDEIPEEIVGIKGAVIKNTREEVTILMNETAESGIIYSNGRASEIADNVQLDGHGIAGKDFRKFISKKYKCTEKVSNVYVYGGERWQDALKLSGDKSYVKFNLEGNNYVRFEVAHQTHAKDMEEDVNFVLDMYVDDELVSSYDEFIDGAPEIVEEYVPDSSTIKLEVRVIDGVKGMNVYIRDGRFKKVKEEKIP